MKDNQIIDDVIKFFGSQTKLATSLGLKQPAVSNWRNNRNGIGQINAQKIEIITNGKFKAIDLCPRLAEIEKLKTHTFLYKFGAIVGCTVYIFDLMTQLHFYDVRWII